MGNLLQPQFLVLFHRRITRLVWAACQEAPEKAFFNNPCCEGWRRSLHNRKVSGTNLSYVKGMLANVIFAFVLLLKVPARLHAQCEQLI